VVAVIGAGRRTDSVCHQVLRNLLAGGFTGAVHSVNPAAAAVAGVRGYPTAGDISGPVDLAVFSVHAPEVAREVERCGAKGVAGLVVLSAGFGEVGDRTAEANLRDVARHNGMRMVGPNCMGVVNTALGLNATFAPFAAAPGRIAMLSQSGALGIALLERSARMGLGVSTFVSVGNMADISNNDLLQFWEDDTGTDVVLLYLESFGNPRKFARIARRVSRAKPIVAVKSGRTGAGTRAASSHTAALASPDVAVDALFRQTGVIRVDTLSEFFDVASLLVHQPLPPGRRVAIVGNAGGPGILAADACEGAGLEVPELGAATQAELRSFLPAAASARNPVDLVASASAGAYERAVRTVLADEAVDAAIVIFIPPLVTRADDVARAVSAAAAGSPKPVLANFLALGGGPEELRSDEATVPSFAYPEAAAKALAHAASYAEWRSRPAGDVPDLADVDEDATREVVERALDGAVEGVWLDAVAAGELLGAYGVPVAPTAHVWSAADASDAATRIGYPAVLKAGSPSIVHKTDVGAVRLDLRSPDEVRAAFEGMAAGLGDDMGGAIVQAMAEPGVEVIVGVVQDPLFGPLVMFGTGGTAVELLGDRSFRVLPLTDVDAHELVRSTRGSPLLFGYRGAPPCDVAALEDLLLRVGRLVDDVPELAEMDLNPVIVSSTGAVAVDAKIRLDHHRPTPASALRRLR
jgi:acetyl coenzyme A synthetase (ADP forming)-like protein